MAPDTIEVRFTLTPADVRAFQWSYARKSWIALPVWIVVAILAVFFFNLDKGSFYYFLLDHGFSDVLADTVTNWLPFGFCFVVIFAAVTIRRRYGARRSPKRAVYWPQQMTVSPEGLHAVRDGLTVNIAWKAIQEIKFRKSMTYFYIDDVQAQIVPAHAFETEDGFVKFNTLARGYFDATHPAVV